MTANNIESSVIADKIKAFMTEQVNRPVKKGVDLAGIIKQLKERRSKKNAKQ